MTNLVKIKNEINKELADKDTFNSLVVTTFKGVNTQLVKRAIMEGVMRGFKFEDFLKKNIYAVPFGQNAYSLVTSIDYARKVGMKSGIVGKSAPEYEEDDKGNIISCAITVKRQVNGYVGKYTAKVYFNEYSTGKSLWASKPRTMIAKVAEMHALRMACPEEASQFYVEEEFESQVKEKPELDLSPYKEKLASAKNITELRKVWADLPAEAKQNGELESLKADLKLKLEEKKKDENA